MSNIADLNVRSDLLIAHRQAWDALGRPGTWWTGDQRLELAATAMAAMTGDRVLPPWMAPSTVDGFLAGDLVAPTAAHDAIYCVATHAGTLSESWYQDITDELGDLAYVEIVSIACTVAAVVALCRAAGLTPWERRDPSTASRQRVVPPDLAPAALNWVRVTSPADEVAAVVQAFTSVPAEHQRLWMMADAQYIPNAEMVDPHRTRHPVAVADRTRRRLRRSFASASTNDGSRSTLSWSSHRVRPRSTSVPLPPARATPESLSATSC